jgi:hypothetical protein
MLFCNPNAGFYEAAFHHNEWFDFYLAHGVSLMLWNYRGYGRTPGTPSVRKLLRDGESVVQFLRSQKKAKLLGVHGESLGGAIACYLADKCGAQFLFADRTFASISQAAYHNFGPVAKLLLKAVLTEDVDAAENFLQARCYKVISCDPRDAMIQDLASLKAGVAAKLTMHKPVLDTEAIKELVTALTRLKDIFSRTGTMKNTAKNYERLQDGGSNEEEVQPEAVQMVKNTINRLEAGGISLLDCMRGKRKQQAVAMWISVLEVWGLSTSAKEDEKEAQDVTQALANTATELEACQGTKELREEVDVVRKALQNIRAVFEARIEANEAKALHTAQEFRCEEYEKAGFLVPLACGHAGPLRKVERRSYEQHLMNASFISRTH